MPADLHADVPAGAGAPPASGACRRCCATSRPWPAVVGPADATLAVAGPAQAFVLAGLAG